MALIQNQKPHEKPTTSNTTIIIASHVAIGDDQNTYAARICNELEMIVYCDWYLPAMLEFNAMKQVKNIIDATAMANGRDVLSDEYWSSTEVTSTYVYTLNINSIFGNNTNKNSTHIKVRAIRSF